MQRWSIRGVDKHLYIRPDLAMLRETQPVKGFEDILMRLAEIGGTRKRERGGKHIASPAEWMCIGEPHPIRHAQGCAG